MGYGAIRIKKIPSAISGCARLSEVNFGDVCFLLVGSLSTAGFDPATANGIAQISLFAKIKSDFLLAAIPSKMGIQTRRRGAADSQVRSTPSARTSSVFPDRSRSPAGADRPRLLPRVEGAPARATLQCRDTEKSERLPALCGPTQISGIVPGGRRGGRWPRGSRSHNAPCLGTKRAVIVSASDDAETDLSRSRSPSASRTTRSSAQCRHHRP